MRNPDRRLFLSWGALSFFWVVSLLLPTAGPAQGANPPAQFQAWGSAGPASPPTPAGWSKAPAGLDLWPSLTATAEERARGCVIFTRDPFAAVGLRAAPAPAERARSVQMFAARGEYEPLLVGIYALEYLKQVRPTLSDLRSPIGAVIPSANVDVRLVRSVRVLADAGRKQFRSEPFLLEKYVAFAVEKESSAFLWLTLKVPETAPPGDYSGTLTLQPGERGRVATQIEMRVKVLPFALPPAPIEMVMYYPRPAEADAMLTKELTDLREHGVIPIPALEVRVKSRDRKFGEDDVAETTAHCRRLMGAIQAVYGPWQFPATFEAGHQIIYAWEPTRNWFVHWEHSPALEADLAKAIQLIADLARDYRVPGLRVYVNDEAGAHNLLDEAVYCNRFVKERFPQIATTTTIGGGIAMGHDEIGQLSGVVDLLSANRFTPEVARALLARQKPYGVYNGAGHTPAGARFFFGFYGWKTGASQIGQWVYSFGESVFSGNGLRQEDEGYVYHGPDGPLPSLMWEAVREGIDDYRYVHLLWSMVLRAKSSPNAQAQAAAARAEAALTRLLGVCDWGFQAMQGSERTPPPHPATLRKWRWQVAQEILALQAFGPAEVTASAQRPSPLDLPWAEPSKEEVNFGPELLPPSGFEGALKPWRVEAWNGKGTSQLDAAEHHSGRQSVRIDVPAASGNQAVTVLVWPQYGENRIDLTLEGDRTYEFSAWVKWKERNTPPDLRVNVPASAVGRTQSGKDPATPDGWQRLWTRVDLAMRAQPGYLAVWVQGPGTVWVDDLSLREIISSPLRVSLDQDEYDELDKVAVATVAVAKRVEPAELVAELISPDGRQRAELRSPFRPQLELGGSKDGLTLVAPAGLNLTRLFFDPSSLPSGQHRLVVRLLDAQGNPEAARQTAFAVKTAHH
jgi:hypothetical protein